MSQMPQRPGTSCSRLILFFGYIKVFLMKASKIDLETCQAGEVRCRVADIYNPSP